VEKGEAVTKIDYLQMAIESNPTHSWAVYGDRKPCYLIESKVIKSLLDDRAQLRNELLKICSINGPAPIGKDFTISKIAWDSVTLSDELEKL
jgi:hypothetical protein